jgi:hypothetical protein
MSRAHVTDAAEEPDGRNVAAIPLFAATLKRSWRPGLLMILVIEIAKNHTESERHSIPADPLRWDSFRAAVVYASKRCQVDFS